MTLSRRIAVVGLGYVGLPVAVAFAEAGLPVVGFDIDSARVDALTAGKDRTGEIDTSRLTALNWQLSADAAALSGCDFFIVTVPTPITAANQPDLRALEAASRMIGRALQPGGIVVYESTVYPGATESVALPILAAESGLRPGADFAIGYSPERINPGDRVHRFETIEKVISASDSNALEIVAAIYGQVVTAPLHRAPSIAVAEAAKVIENTQRDLNIALMNELSMIFHRLGIDTQDVLAAARTKWNFLPFVPGLVGGHCIGVDPYYLTHRAESVGYHPEVILAGRRINDEMGRFAAREVVKRLLAGGKGAGARVTVLGVTFKEDVPDVRNSRVFDLVEELEAFGMQVVCVDPVADAATVARDYGRKLASLGTSSPVLSSRGGEGREATQSPSTPSPPVGGEGWGEEAGRKTGEEAAEADAVILAVPHRVFLEGGWPMMRGLLKDGTGLVADLKAKLDRTATPERITLWRL